MQQLPHGVILIKLVNKHKTPVAVPAHGKPSLNVSCHYHKPSLTSELCESINHGLTR